MDTGDRYEVSDMGLAEQGKKNIAWAEMHMGALMKIKERFGQEKPLRGVKISMALHITKETAALARTLVAGGAQVAICSCNPLSTQDDAAAALAQEGVFVYGYKGESTEDYYRFLRKVIAFGPNITIDDGCDLVTEIHKNYPQLIADIWGGNEETTTGIMRLKSMEKSKALKYPIIAVNDNKTKHLTDNYYGTGQSTLDGIMRATNILFAGKTVVVCGYGSCGKGIALRAKGLGANVIVTEVDHFRALQAVFDGFRVMPLAAAVQCGDMFITVTGNKHVIDLEHMKKMKDGAVLANSGHFDVEIDVKGLEEHAEKQKIRPFLDEYRLDGKRLYVAAEGRLVNLSAAEGHPSTVMSLSFCGQALAVEYIVKNRGTLPIKVLLLPDELDDEIARLQLGAMHVSIDMLTDEQKNYITSWEFGT